jgi:hypothetical protein
MHILQGLHLLWQAGLMMFLIQMTYTPVFTLLTSVFVFSSVMVMRIYEIEDLKWQ